MSTILVVDDEQQIRRALDINLHAHGYEVRLAASGEEALTDAAANLPDLVLLDLGLPGIDGVDVIRGLRGWTSIPIIVLSARDADPAKVEALDAGADDYVTKPFSFVVLVARIRALLRRGASERPAVLEAGDLRFDPATRRAWRADTEVDLTARESALLEFLLRRKGDVVSKREILDHVWDYTFDGDPNIVEVYVGHLRNKLDRPFGRATLETIRGVGYRLADDGS